MTHRKGDQENFGSVGPKRNKSAAPITVIAVHSGAGARDDRTGHGAASLKEAGLDEWLDDAGLAARWIDILPEAVPRNASIPDRRLDTIVNVTERLSLAVGETVRNKQRFAIIGGDHSCAIGTWSGVYNALDSSQPLGLIWLDAHMDSHIPETSPSGNWHGMPVAHLLGLGVPTLVKQAQPGPAILPQHICLVGVRSFEPKEAELLKRLGVRVIGMEEVKLIGIDAAIGQALAIATDCTAGFGVSLDLDVIDPEDAPGVGSPVKGGISGRDIVSMFERILRREDWLGIEIVEFNPYVDHADKTLRLIQKLFRSFYRKD